MHRCRVCVYRHCLSLSFSFFFSNPKNVAFYNAELPFSFFFSTSTHTHTHIFHISSIKSFLFCFFFFSPSLYIFRSFFLVFKDEAVIFFYSNSFHVHIYFSVQLLILCALLSSFDDLSQHLFVCALFHFFNKHLYKIIMVRIQPSFLPLFSISTKTTQVSYSLLKER